MKHLFIVNPVSGGKKHNPAVTGEMIAKAMSDIDDPYEIYYTTAPKDACRKIEAEAKLTDDLRVYACGGDGTLNECVSSAAQRENVSVTQFPCGTGNDFIRMFGEDAAKFKSFKALVNGKKHKVDVIKCGDNNYSVNICSVGIDARIGTDVHKYSQIPVIGGATGYITSLVVNVFKGINTKMTVIADGKEKTDMYALICACNGRYYGGGFNPVPEAEIDDGIIDVLVVSEVNLISVPSLLGKYSAGRYAELTDYITHIRTNKIQIKAEKDFVVNIDGEAIYTNDIELEMIPDGLNLIVPDGVRYFERSRKREKIEV